MVAQLIWIAAVYAFAAALVHMLHNREQTRRSPCAGKWIHYILITRNHESVVEWYIRALTFHGFVTGRRLRVTLMDDGSYDQTLGVVSRLASSGCSLDLTSAMPILPLNEELQQQGIVVDLRLSGQPVPLPFMGMAGSRGCGSKRSGM